MPKISASQGHTTGLRFACQDEVYVLPANCFQIHHQFIKAILIGEVQYQTNIKYVGLVGAGCGGRCISHDNKNATENDCKVKMQSKTIA